MRTLREASYAALFAALTAVSAQVTIPLPLVPITLQVMVTLLAGAVLGARTGAGSQLVYVLMGAVGLPVFAARNGGIGALIGPTGGYLIGFIAGAWIAGLGFELAERRFGHSRTRYNVLTAAALLAGLVTIHIPGLTVLAWHIGSASAAIRTGLITFLPGDLIKVIAAWLVARALKARGVGPGMTH